MTVPVDRFSSEGHPPGGKTAEEPPPNHRPVAERTRTLFVLSAVVRWEESRTRLTIGAESTPLHGVVIAGAIISLLGALALLSPLFTFMANPFVGLTTITILAIAFFAADGVLFGANLLTSGLALVMLGLADRRTSKSGPSAGERGLKA